MQVCNSTKSYYRFAFKYLYRIDIRKFLCISLCSAEIKSFVCQYCNKPFGAKADLNYHIEARHIVPKDFFVCSIANCGKQLVFFFFVLFCFCE